MSDKIKFSELVKAFAESHDITQQKAENLIRGVFNLLLDDLEKEGKASITNFGSFELKEVAERTGINPQTKEEIIIPAHNKVSFKPFKALEQTVNAPFAHLESKLIEEDSSETKTTPPVVPVETSSAKEDDDQEDFEDPFESVISPENEETYEDFEDKMEEEEAEEESAVPPPVYKAKEPEGNSSGMLLILVILLIAIVGVGGWYFFLRDSGSADYSNQVADKQPAQNEQPVVEAEKPVVTAEDNSTKEMPAVSATDKKAPTENQSSTSVEETKTPKEMTTYIIKKDEWMWDISRKVYGKAYLWPLIFESNKKATDNPNLVEPAKTLIVPSLEGDSSALTKSDYARLAKASKMVSEAYGNAGIQDRAAEYLRFSKKYERMSKE